MQAQIKLALKGMAMGIAEVIPGVSGGTIAFITGIYERLINAIKSVDGTFFKLLFSGKFKEMWEHIDGWFLTFLVAGMAAGIITGVFGVTHLMDNYPEELWGFFFGLILASAIYIGKQVPSWSMDKFVLLAVGGILAYLITIIAPAEGTTNLLYVFFSGVIAISALILPGISGSFILLLMGMYTVVVPSVKDVLSMDFSAFDIVAVFAVGCLLGLASFSRVLSWLFKNHHDRTLAFLTGIMLGSLNKIWPWRNPTKWVTEEGEIVTDPSGFEDLKVLAEQNVLPANYLEAPPNTMIVILCAVVGFAIVFALDRALGSQDQ